MPGWSGGAFGPPVTPRLSPSTRRSATYVVGREPTSLARADSATWRSGSASTPTSPTSGSPVSTDSSSGPNGGFPVAANTMMAAQEKTSAYGP